MKRLLKKGAPMWQLLVQIKQNLSWAVLIALIGGLAVGYFFDLSIAKPLLLPLTIGMIYPMMVPLQFRMLIQKCNLKLLSLTQLLNFVVIPLVAVGIAKFFFPPESPFSFVLLLIAILPTSGMTISWTGLAKGNLPAAVKITLSALIASVLLLPVYTHFFASSVQISVGAMLQRVLLIIGLPLVAGQITQSLIIRKSGKERFQKEIKPRFPLFSTLAVLLMIFLAVGLKAKVIVSEPALLLSLLLPLSLFYGISYLLSFGLGKLFLSKENSISMIFGTAMRNLSVALAVAVTTLQGEAAQGVVLISLAFVLQIQSASLFVKQLSRKTNSAVSA